MFYLNDLFNSCSLTGYVLLKGHKRIKERAAR